jgi:hypothetical protein
MDLGGVRLTAHWGDGQRGEGSPRFNRDKDLAFWLELALAYNPTAKKWARKK